MKRKKPLTEFEIASRIRSGVDFTVTTEKERKKVLSAAKFLGASLQTRANGAGFTVKMFHPCAAEE